MINWNVDEEKYKNKYPKDYVIWRLAQIINYGLNGEKLNINVLKTNWAKIKNRLDPDKQKVLEFYIWNKPWHREPGLLPDRSNFWQWYLKRSISSTTSI